MKLAKQLLNLYEAMFTDKKTGHEPYDSYLKNPKETKARGINFKIMKIDPNTYVDMVVQDAKEQGISRSKLVDSRLANKKIIDKLVKSKDINMPILGYHDNFFQEGLHRALAAIIAGEKEIPVMVTYRSESDLPKELK